MLYRYARRLAGAGIAAAALAAAALSATTTGVVIAEVYGGGGSSSTAPYAPYANDFIVLYNTSDQAVAIGGWSLQYMGATSVGTVGSSNLTVLPAGASIAPKHYYLVQEGSAGSAAGSPALPVAADATGGIGLSNANGKVFLVNGPNAISVAAGTPVTVDPGAGQAVVDAVGYGTSNYGEGGANAPGLTRFSAVFRKAGGSQDTDNNGADFVLGSASPLNSSASALRIPAGAAVAGSPSAFGEAAYFGADDGKVYGVSTVTGQTMYDFPFDTRANGAGPAAKVIARPSVHYVGGELWVYAVTDDGVLFGISSAGKKRWASETLVQGATGVAAMPAVALLDDPVGGLDNYVFVAVQDGSSAYLVKVNARTGEIVRRSPPLGAAVVSSPALGAGAIYVGVTGGIAGDVVRLSAYDFTALAGIPVAVGEGVNASPFVLENSPFPAGPAVIPVVYIATNAGNVYACQATTGQMETTFGGGGVASVAPGVALSHLYAYPSGPQARVYTAGSDNKVYALEAGTGAPAGFVPPGGAAAGFVVYDASTVSTGGTTDPAKASSNVPTAGSIVGGVSIDPAHDGGPGAVVFGSTNGFFYQVPLNAGFVPTGARVYCPGAPVRTNATISPMTGVQTTAIGDDEGAVYSVPRY